MSDHLLIVNDQEARLLGALYSLGAMAGLATLLDDGKDEELLFQASRQLVGKMLDMKEFAEMNRTLRDRILELVKEAERDATKRQEFESD